MLWFFEALNSILSVKRKLQKRLRQEKEFKRARMSIAAWDWGILPILPSDVWFHQENRWSVLLFDYSISMLLLSPIPAIYFPIKAVWHKYIISCNVVVCEPSDQQMCVLMWKGKWRNSALASFYINVVYWNDWHTVSQMWDKNELHSQMFIVWNARYVLNAFIFGDFCEFCLTYLFIYFLLNLLWTLETQVFCSNCQFPFINWKLYVCRM